MTGPSGIHNNQIMQDLNSSAARITLNGKRHYTTPLATGPAPSVTTIISETASEANKKKLEMWSKAPTDRDWETV